MKFYHGGHLGDLVYALYTLKRLDDIGEGPIDLAIGPGQPICWDESHIEAAFSLCAVQPYINSCEIVDSAPDDLECFMPGMYDLRNQKYFFEWHGGSLPGNMLLRKRWYMPYMMKRFGFRKAIQLLNHDEPWLSVNSNTVSDVIMHLPKRKLCRSPQEWERIVAALSDLDISVTMIGGSDISEWNGELSSVQRLHPGSLLAAAEMIAGAKLFLGGPSAPYAIAEGLNQFNLVDLTDIAECSGPMNERGWDCSTWSPDRVIEAASLVVKDG